MKRVPIWQQRRTYRMRYACFNCRKSFAIKNHTREDRIVCPQCGQPMVNMGVNFKPPRQSDEKAWRAIEILRREGYRFSGYGEVRRRKRL